MTEKLDGKPPEAGSEQEKPVEGAAQQGAVYDGPIEKFKGKTAAEIAQSYAETEKAVSDRDRALKEAQDKISGYEQYYRQQQMQQQQVQQPPQQPVDIYDNPQAYIQNTVTPILDKRLEQIEFQHSLESANQAKYIAKQMYPDAFSGVDEGKLDSIMFGGVNSGGINHRALRDPKGWVMAAGQMKLAEMDYKFSPSAPQPMNPTQTEAPTGRTSASEEPRRMTANQAEMARLFSDTTNEKRAQELLRQAEKETTGEEL